jgi:hypothetical protein
MVRDGRRLLPREYSHASGLAASIARRHPDAGQLGDGGAMPFLRRNAQPKSIHRFNDGRYRMANPALGRIKHHAANQLSVDINEIAGYLKTGYLLRMRGERSKK